MSQHRATIRRPRRASRASRGIVLVTTLLVLVILTLLGTAAVFTSATELEISGNGRSDLQVFALAEAGVHEALARVNMTAGTGRIVPGVDPLNGNLIPAWSATIVNKATPGANETPTLTGAFGSSTALPYSTIVRYKLEDANEAPVAHCNGACDGEVVRFHTNYDYAGTGVPTGAQVGNPVLEFVSTVSIGAGPTATVGAEAVNSPVAVNIRAPLMACGRVSTTGGSTVNAMDHTTQVPIYAGLGINMNTGSNISHPQNNVENQLWQAGSFCPATGGNYGSPWGLPRQTAADRQLIFQQTFGMTADEMKAKADFVVTGPWAPARNAVITDKKIIWVEPGNDAVSWNRDAQIGTPEQPVIIVVRGNLSISSQMRIYGVIFTFGAATMGNAQFSLQGAMVSAASTLWDGAPYQTTLSGQTSITYDPNIINRLGGAQGYAVSLWRVE